MNTDQESAMGPDLTDQSLNAQAQGEPVPRLHEGPHGGLRDKDHALPHLSGGGPEGGPSVPGTTWTVTTPRRPNTTSALPSITVRRPRRTGGGWWTRLRPRQPGPSLMARTPSTKRPMR